MLSNSALWQEIQQGESKTLEFKQQLPKGEQLVFKETGDFFDIEFLRDVQQSAVSEGGQINDAAGGQAGGQVGGQIGGQITESQRSVLLLIQNKPQISRQELAKALQINPSAVQKHIENLKAQGVIERIGGTRGYWQVKI